MNFLFGFSGRIGRGGWWLGQFLAFFVLVGTVAFGGIVAAQGTPDSPGTMIIVLLCGYVLSVWINVAASVKRYHDRDKPWPWVLVMLIPFIGSIWQLVECGFLAGSPGMNGFGYPPGSGAGPRVAPDTYERFPGGGKEADTDVVERWKITSVLERTAPAATAGRAPTPARTATRPGGPTTFGRRGI